MTTPPAGPDFSPDQGVWSAPPAPLAPRPTSMLLPLEGAAGTHIEIFNLDKSVPYVLIDGVAARTDINGYFLIPMARGRAQKLQVRATVPGYPTIKFRGKTLYKSPQPPIVHVLAYFVAALGGVILGVALGWGVSSGRLSGLLALLLGVPIGLGVARWLRTANDKRLPVVVSIAGGVLLALVGVVVIIARIRLGS